MRLPLTDKDLGIVKYLKITQYTSKVIFKRSYDQSFDNLISFGQFRDKYETSNDISYIRSKEWDKEIQRLKILSKDFKFEKT